MYFSLFRTGINICEVTRRDQGQPSVYTEVVQHFNVVTAVLALVTVFLFHALEDRLAAFLNSRDCAVEDALVAFRVGGGLRGLRDKVEVLLSFVFTVSRLALRLLLHHVFVVEERVLQSLIDV